MPRQRTQKETADRETKAAREKPRGNQQELQANPQAVFRRFVRMLEKLQAGKTDTTRNKL